MNEFITKQGKEVSALISFDRLGCPQLHLLLLWSSVPSFCQQLSKKTLMPPCAQCISWWKSSSELNIWYIIVGCIKLYPLSRLFWASIHLKEYLLYNRMMSTLLKLYICKINLRSVMICTGDPMTIVSIRNGMGCTEFWFKQSAQYKATVDV